MLSLSKPNWVPSRPITRVAAISKCDTPCPSLLFPAMSCPSKRPSLPAIRCSLLPTVGVNVWPDSDPSGSVNVTQSCLSSILEFIISSLRPSPPIHCKTLLPCLLILTSPSPDSCFLLSGQPIFTLFETGRIFGFPLLLLIVFFEGAFLIRLTVLALRMVHPDNSRVTIP